MVIERSHVKNVFLGCGVEFPSMWGAENTKTTAICFMINTLDVSSVRAENRGRDKDGNQFFFLSAPVADQEPLRGSYALKRKF